MGLDGVGVGEGGVCLVFGDGAGVVSGGGGEAVRVGFGFGDFVVGADREVGDSVVFAVFEFEGGGGEFVGFGVVGVDVDVEVEVLGLSLSGVAAGDVDGFGDVEGAGVEVVFDDGLGGGVVFYSVVSAAVELFGGEGGSFSVFVGGVADDVVGDFAAFGAVVADGEVGGGFFDRVVGASFEVGDDDFLVGADGGFDFAVLERFFAETSPVSGDGGVGVGVGELVDADAGEVASAVLF